METVQLQAQKRETAGKTAAKERVAGRVPGVVYGHNFENQSVSVHGVEFEKVYEKAGESTLVDLTIDGGDTVKVLIQDVQRDPVKDVFTHIDFRAVNMKEKVEAEIPLAFVGVSPAIKEQGGILVTVTDAIHVKALPTDLVHEIEVDLTVLKALGDTISAGDLTIPSTLEVLTDPTVVVALAEAPRTAAEVESDLSPEEAEKAAIEAAQGTEGGEGEAKKESDKKE